MVSKNLASIEIERTFSLLGVLNGSASRSLHSPSVALEDMARRVSAPLPLSRPPSLPPIEDRRNGSGSTSTKAEQLFQNQQRIARLMKHLK